MVEGVLPIAQLAAVAQNHSTVSVTLPGNVSSQLDSLYTQYEAYVSGGSVGAFKPTGVSTLVLSGTHVGVNIHTPLKPSG